MASIQVIQGSDKDQTFELVDGENVIGRVNCNVRLTDTTISRNHAKIEPREDGQWMIEDLGSANGTFVNGVKLEKQSLIRRGDQIRIGGSLMVFAESSRPKRDAPIETPEGKGDEGQVMDSSIVATVPSNQDSMIMASPEEPQDKALANVRIIYELISELGSIFDEEKLIQKALSRTFRILKPERGVVLLLDEKRKVSKKVARVAADAADRKTPISKTIINEVVRKQVGVLSSNAMTDKRFQSGQSVQDLNIRSTICVPIKGRDRILGIFQLDRSVNRQTFGHEELRLMTAIGYQMGLAIENVRLHKAAVQSERLAAVGETVALLSHHIKNILQALQGGMDVVESGIRGGDLQQAQEGWPVLQRNLERINDFILNMLAYSKSRKPKREQVNVNEVLQEIAALIAARADERGVALMTELNNVPPVSGDADGLHQAVLNLVQNAMDAVQDEFGIITVRTEFEPSTQQVTIQVTDNGHGIPEQQREQVFTPFYSTKGQKGTGLGLAAVKKIVEELGGQVQVESEVDEGTTMTISLPSALSPEGSETVLTDTKVDRAPARDTLAAEE